jgi:hypothetical protein
MILTLSLSLSLSQFLSFVCLSFFSLYSPISTSVRVCVWRCLDNLKML